MRFLEFILLIIASIPISAQEIPTEVAMNNEYGNSCGKVLLGSGFEKSGMTQYVARPKILEAKWNSNSLNIKIFVVSECCPPDYLGYIAKSDALILYFGIKTNLPDGQGEHQEFEICMCGFNGCCYEFEYNINGLNQETNYLIAISNVSGMGTFDPFPIGYLDGKQKSIRYLNRCDNPEACLVSKINEALNEYKKLSDLYNLLLMQIENENEEKSETLKQITRTWIKYFESRLSIEDDFIVTKLDANVYSERIDEFEFHVKQELELLIPILNEVEKYVQMGAFIEPISELKIER